MKGFPKKIRDKDNDLFKKKLKEKRNALNLRRKRKEKNESKNPKIRI